MREAQLSQLRAKEVEAAEKVRAANERVVESLDAEREALTQTERERFVAQALSRLSAEATAQQRREVEQLAGALYDEQQALQARQRLMDEGRSVIDRTRTATEQHAAEIAEAERAARSGRDRSGDLRPCGGRRERPRAPLEPGVDRRRHPVPEGLRGREQRRGHRHRAGVRECLLLAQRTRWSASSATGKLEFQGLADSILADLARMTVRQTITAPLAGALQSAFAGGGLSACSTRAASSASVPPATRYADAAVFEHAPRYHGGGFAGSGLLPDEVPIIARRGELVVPPERVVREEKSAREQRPITVVVNVTAADASSFRASQGQIAADMARAIDRASRNR